MCLKLVTLWMRSALDVREKPNVRITFYGPDGTPAPDFEAKFSVDLSSTTFRRSTVNVSAVPYLGQGRL